MVACFRTKGVTSHPAELEDDDYDPDLVEGPDDDVVASNARSCTVNSDKSRSDS